MFFNNEQFVQEVQRWENRLVTNCPICKGTGSIPTTSKVDKMCTCKSTAILNSNLVSWGIPRKYLTENWTWENCDPQEFVRQCKQYADNFVNHYYNSQGLYLFGSQGRGKSTMEALIAKEVVAKINPDTKKHFRVAFVIYEEIIQLSHQARVDNNAKYKYEMLINKPDLLILDNVGSETGLGNESKHTVKVLDFILRKRDNLGVPTIISSNFSPEELKKNYSDPVHDFVVQNCELVSVTGDNFRTKSSPLDDWGM